MVTTTVEASTDWNLTQGQSPLLDSVRLARGIRSQTGNQVEVFRFVCFPYKSHMQQDEMHPAGGCVAQQTS